MVTMADNAQMRTLGSRDLPLAAPLERRPCHYGPDPANWQEASRSKKPRHDLGTGPWVFGAVAWETEKVNGYPEKAEQCRTCSRKGDVGCYGEDAFSSHSAASHMSP